MSTNETSWEDLGLQPPKLPDIDMGPTGTVPNMVATAKNEDEDSIANKDATEDDAVSEDAVSEDAVNEDGKSDEAKLNEDPESEAKAAHEGHDEVNVDSVEVPELEPCEESDPDDTNSEGEPEDAEAKSENKPEVTPDAKSDDGPSPAAAVAVAPSPAAAAEKKVSAPATVTATQLPPGTIIAPGTHIPHISLPHPSFAPYFPLARFPHGPPPGFKKRGRPLGSKNKSPKKQKIDADDSSNDDWERLKDEICTQLRAMPSDECFVRALELKQLAVSEVQRHSTHLVSAMNMINQNSSVPLSAASVDTNLKKGSDWLENYHQLVQFYRVNGHCNVPPSEHKLYQWVIHQKDTRKKLNDEKTSLLNQIGFEWDKGFSEAPATAPSSSGNDTATNPSLPHLAPASTFSPHLPIPPERPQICHKIPKANLGPMCEPDPKNDHVPVPEFRQLVNYPNAKHFARCVMCNDDTHKIPKQNKGVCTSCDEGVWMLLNSGMQIRWCKGCKNFKKWISFGIKGHSTKCERCRTQQAERYALNKKERAIDAGVPAEVVESLDKNE
eukprot:CAMPEP_0171337358 /NCGR_PEP_ID=MMETSP0878-20121228/6642_1 /TAXON_ID=67004 /ORGANISM="Thalassiosira weissflogii, Strain CCMP1336" /LENGTH=553 /DNA_ID=CAMNT_0011838977 /DNA_START=147 /DNA_END=1808 /DNA_ORIENTATION=+